MNLDLFVIITNLGGLFLLLGVGVFSVKLNVLPVTAAAPFSGLLLKVSLPCIIFTAMQQPFSMEFLLDSARIIGINFLLFGLNLLLSLLLVRLLRIPEGSRGVWCLLVSFCNNGFMGFPVVFALFGAEGLALASMINVPVCVILYSTVAGLIGRDRKGAGVNKPKLRQVLITPINMAILLGVISFLTQLPVPEVVLNPIRLLGSTTTPLSMLVTGMVLSEVRLHAIFRDVVVWKATFVRLLVFPALALFVITLIPLQNPLVPGVTLVTMSMPAAAVVTSLAETYGGNRELSVKVIFLTSLLCIITIPLFALTL